MNRYYPPGLDLLEAGTCLGNKPRQQDIIQGINFNLCRREVPEFYVYCLIPFTKNTHPWTFWEIRPGTNLLTKLPKESTQSTWRNIINTYAVAQSRFLESPSGNGRSTPPQGRYHSEETKAHFRQFLGSSVLGFRKSSASCDDGQKGWQI